ncbi:hypothetical protein ACQKWADRAFT_313797 [Trichoderma austrokoningii]
MASNVPSAAGEEDYCSKGTAFYSCEGNNFRGCCSVDPCDLSSCPDTSFGSLKDPKDGDKSNGSSKPIVSMNDEAAATPTPITSSRPTATSKESAVMTDSGITHTIPNNSIVTIIRHTTIVTGRPSVTTSSSTDPIATTSFAPAIEPASSTSEGTAAPSYTAFSSETASSAHSGASPLSPGAIVGIAVGGVALIAIIVVTVLTLLRRKKQRRSEASDFDLHQDNGRDDVVEEKHFPHPVSAHTTSTQGSSDPFAPFGGRADKPEDPYPPASGAFEMDGSSAAPIELPAMSVSSPSTNTHKPSRLEPVQEITTSAPRANLTSVPEWTRQA